MISRTPFGRFHVLILLLLLFLTCFSPTIIFAQSTYGTITGTVTDPTGAVIANATILLTSRSTQTTRTITTNTEGNYLLANLDPGLYSIDVSATGFAKTSKSVELLARQIVRLDVRVETAATLERVDIIAQSAITTDSATISDSKSGREINGLALNFRATTSPSPIVVATMSPGVQQDRSGNISVAGGQPYTTSFSIDGISTQSVRGGGAVRDLFPSVEGIAEFKVNSSNNNAEFGQVSDVTTISKSGSNDYHGTGFWFHQNNKLNATNPFGPVSNGKRLYVPGHANSFGAALNGPISIPKIYNAKNRTFFFFDYEGVRRGDPVTLNQIVPPDAFRNGDLSTIATPLRNPFTGGTYTNNQIPVNPAAAKVLDLLYVKQNQSTGAAINKPNFVTSFANRYLVNGFDARVDHNFSDAHKVYARFTYKDVETRGTDGGGSFNTKFGEYSAVTNVRNLAGSYNWIIRPNLINELRGGYTMNDILQDYPLAKQGAQITQSIGLTGLPKAPALGGIPNFSFTDGSFIGTNSTGRPHFTGNTTYQFNDSLTWTTGRHTYKGGVDVQKLKFQDYLSFFAGDDFGEYSFSGGFTGNAFADFLLGLPTYTTYAANGPDVKPYAYHYAFYFQDDFRLSQKLTINYGLRYELHPPFNDETNQLANFDRVTKGGRVLVQNSQGLALVAPSFRTDIGNTPIILGKDAGLPDTLRNTDKNDFNPRFGFAYRPFNDNKTVIRGGAGVYTITVLGSVLYSLAGIATSNAPVFANAVTAPGQYRLLLPNVFPTGTTAGSGGIPDFRRANQTNLTDPYSIQWNLTIERELLWNTGLRLTYTGSKTRNLIYSPDLNQVPANTLGYDAVKATRPFPNFNAVLTRDNGPSAKYHAFTVEFSRRFSNGVSFQNSYTLAKNLSNAGGPAPGGFASENGPTTLNIFNIAADYGDVAFTRRHRFLSTFLWELPIGKQRKYLTNLNGALDAVIGGWQVNGIMLLQSGPYLTPTFTGTDPSGTGVLVRGVTTTQRPDRIGNGNLSNPTLDAYFDKAAFVRPASNIGRFGNAGVGILRGPGTEVFSATLAKQFSLTEKLKLRYEAAFSNLFNHLNPNAPGTLNITSSAFGRITSTQTVDQAGPRVIQMSLRVAF